MTIALSYSRISDYRQCPLKFKFKYLDKNPVFTEDGSKSPHLVRGSNVHKALENYIIKKNAGEVDIRPSTLPEVESTRPLLDGLFSMYTLHPELQVAIDENFQPVDWFSKDAWFRAILDVIGFGDNLLILDFKTGRMTDYSGSMKEPGQLHLSSLVGMAVWPQYDDVDNRYIYVDHRKSVPLKLNRKEHYESLKATLVAEHNSINAECNWSPKKNVNCQWCAASTDMCEYSKKQVLPGR